MAIFNLDFYNSQSDALYSDGDIEQELLEIVKNPFYDWFQDGRWPVVYHLSHLRHNILNWYPFKPNSRILEIGAGCGALTGLLCKRASKVVAVELTRQRAEINFQRHQHFDNLEVVVCDIQNIPDTWGFDYIIVNGVMEYAASMFESDDPYEEFLKVTKSHLYQDGKILLSIENRLGLKYLAGAREDHTGQFFSGINGYQDGEKVKTFSKVELTELINNSGLNVLKFYYPYPDYKFPVEIFTDTTVNKITPTAPDYPMDMMRVKFYDEKEVLKSFVKLGIMENFSNSFLVELALHKFSTAADVSYVKISANRKEQYRICTVIDEEMESVLKVGLSSTTKNHLEKMKGYSGYDYTKDGQIQNIECVSKDGFISYPFISEMSMEDILVKAFQKNDLDGFIRVVGDFKNALFKNSHKEFSPEGFEMICGSERCAYELHWSANSNLDMIASNIFVIDGKYKVIDYEWQFPNESPLEFIVWRLLTQLINDYEMNSFFSKTALYEFLQINEEMERCFIAWENYFASEVVAISSLFNLSQDIISLDIEKAALQYLKESKLESTLFFDIGNGYSSRYLERKQTTRDSDFFSVVFTQETLKKAKVLRWDPLEGNACRIKIKNIETDGEVTAIHPVNAFNTIEEHDFIFYTFDPQIEIEGNFINASYLNIEFYCDILDWTEGYFKLEGLLIHAQEQLEQQAFIAHGQLEKMTIQYQELLEESSELKSFISNLQNDLHKFKQENEDISNQLKENTANLLSTSKNLEETESKFVVTQNNLEYTQRRLNQLIEFSKNQRLKAMKNILVYGDVTRGLFDE